MKSLVACAAVLALFVALGAPTTAVAEDGKRGETFLYEIRIVRVDPKAAADSEAGSPFPELTETTIDLPWKTVLERLKKRGHTTVLMDTRMSAAPGIKSEVTDERITPIVALNFEDWNNQQYRSQPVKIGSTFKQTTSAQLSYQIAVRGTATAPATRRAPAQYMIQWNGSHPRLGGQTLVLEHRQQVVVALPTPESSPGMEHRKRTAAALSEVRQAMQAREKAIDALKARITEVERGIQVTARRDTLEALKAELETLRRRHVTVSEELASLRKKHDGLAGSRDGGRERILPPVAAETRAVEHYAFITGRFVAGR